MPDFPKLPIITPPTNSFPELPIVTPDPPRLTLREKYGNFYYFGIAGLIVSLSLVFQFSYGLWASWDTWKAFFVLAHPLKPEAERIQAAWFLRHSPDINDAQRADIALRKELPTLGRYLVAEGLSPHAIQVDPKAYALMVAKSEGWPDWLRLLMARPMAYGVGEGYRFAWEALELLRQNPDPRARPLGHLHPGRHGARRSALGAGSRGFGQSRRPVPRTRHAPRSRLEGERDRPDRQARRSDPLAPASSPGRSETLARLGRSRRQARRRPDQRGSVPESQVNLPVAKFAKGERVRKVLMRTEARELQLNSPSFLVELVVLAVQSLRFRQCSRGSTAWRIAPTDFWLNPL